MATRAIHPPSRRDDRAPARFAAAVDLMAWLRARECEVCFTAPTRLALHGPEDVLQPDVLRECRRHRTVLIALVAPREPVPPPSGRCYICRMERWRERPTGGWVCGVCHPAPEVRLPTPATGYGDVAAGG